MKTRPLLSTDGGYQRPPPLFTSGWPKSLAPPLMVLNFQIVFPVAASRDQTMPTRRAGRSSSTLPGMVETSTLLS